MSRMHRDLLIALTVLLMVSSRPASAQIRVNPTGVNVSTQTATTVFLTYGGLAGYTPVEAIWCGALIPAAPGIGQRCHPATIYGALPVRYDVSTASGLGALTDVMSVPVSVARRAFQDAEAGQSSEFFYVRRFTRPGAPDQFVAVTCRLSGGGARTPLSLVDVQLAFGVDTPVVSTSYQVQPGSSITIDLLRDPAFTGVRANSPRGFMGSARVSSATAVAVHVVHDLEISRRSVYDHNGLPRAEGSALLHVPLVVSDIDAPCGGGSDPGHGFN